MNILSAIDSVKSWMSSNRLLLNYDKTRFIWFGTRQQLAKRDIHQLQAVSEALTSDDSVRNLGVLVDSELKFYEHFLKLSQNCFFQLRRMRSIRRSVSREAMLTLAHALTFVTVCSWESVPISWTGWGCSQSWMQPLDWSWTFQSLDTSRMKFVRTFTGCRSANESATKSATLFVIVWLVQLRNIWGRFVNPPVQHPVVNTFVLHSETTFWCLVSGQRITVPEDLLFLDLGCGTHCLCLFVNYIEGVNSQVKNSWELLCLLKFGQPARIVV